MTQIEKKRRCICWMVNASVNLHICTVWSRHSQYNLPFLFIRYSDCAGWSELWSLPTFVIKAFFSPCATKSLQHQKMYLWTCAPSKDSDQRAHSRSPIKTFNGDWRIWIAKDAKFLHANNEDWSDCAHAQADLSLCRAHVRRYVFSRNSSNMNSTDWDRPV